MGKLLSEAASLGDNEIPLSSFQYFTATLVGDGGIMCCGNGRFFHGRIGRCYKPA